MAIAPLLIDIGNTRVKWAIAQQPIMTKAMPHHQRTNFLDSTQWHEISKPSAIFLASVGKHELGDEIARYAQQHWGLDVTFLSSQTEILGVKNGYTSAQQLGVDRWLNMIAAWVIYHRPVYIVSMGTAITVDVIDRSGVHQGGWIIPGLEMMHSGLQKNTENIKVFHPKQKGLFGCDTRTAVSNGIVFMVSGGLQHLLVNAQNFLGVELLPIITGGGAATCLPFLAVDFKVEPDLIMKGMYYWVETFNRSD